MLRSLWLCSFPEGSTCLSSTSTPTTLGFIGFGYFCIAAVVTVSQGWLRREHKHTLSDTRAKEAGCTTHRMILYRRSLPRGHCFLTHGVKDDAEGSGHTSHVCMSQHPGYMHN